MSIDSRIIVGLILISLGVIVALLAAGVIPTTALINLAQLIMACIIIATLICVGFALLVLGKREREIEEAE